MLFTSVVPFMRCIGKKSFFMRRMEKRLSATLFFTLLIRISLESYLELTLSTFLNIDSLKWNKSGEIIGSTISVVLLAIVIVLPFAINVSLTKFRRIIK
jgi:hypothetical protein